MVVLGLCSRNRHTFFCFLFPTENNSQKINPISKFLPGQPAPKSRHQLLSKTTQSYLIPILTSQENPPPPLHPLSPHPSLDSHSDANLIPPLPPHSFSFSSSFSLHNLKKGAGSYTSTLLPEHLFYFEEPATLKGLPHN